MANSRFLKNLNVFLSQKKQKFTVIGVCGLGGSGKTTLCKKAVEKFPDRITVFEIDWYASPSDERRNTILNLIADNNFKELEFWEQPINWYNWDSLTSDLETLTNKKSLTVWNAWDQDTGLCNKKIELTINTEPHILLVEGIYLLHKPIRNLLNYVYMIDVDIETTIERAESRDEHKHPPQYLEFKKDVRYNFDKNYFKKNSKNVNTILTTPQN